MKVKDRDNDWGINGKRRWQLRLETGWLWWIYCCRQIWEVYFRYIDREREREALSACKAHRLACIYMRFAQKPILLWVVSLSFDLVAEQSSLCLSYDCRVSWWVNNDWFPHSFRTVVSFVEYITCPKYWLVIDITHTYTMYKGHRRHCNESTVL